MENIKESVDSKTDNKLEQSVKDKQEIKIIDEKTIKTESTNKNVGDSKETESAKTDNKELDGKPHSEEEQKTLVKSDKLISKDKLLEFGTHYGHETRRWNPAMKPFIAKAQKMANSRKQIHMISPSATAMTLEISYNAMNSIASKGGTFLFVGTNKRAEKTIQENSERAGVFYVNHRWLGGTLTNFRTIQNSVKKLRMLERLEKSEFEGYTKKEALHMGVELKKLEKSLGGIKFMRRLPTAIFVTSIFEEDIAIKEANKLHIPVFGIADTNVDPSTVRFPIVANDDANKSIALITTLMADAIVEAKGGTAMAAYRLDEDVKVVGIDETQIRQPQAQQSFNNRQPVRKFSNKPTEKQIRVLVNNGFTAEGVTFAMANEAISIIAGNEWKLKGKEKEVSAILKQEPTKKVFVKYSGKSKAGGEQNNTPRIILMKEFKNLKEKVDHLDLGKKELVEFKELSEEIVEHCHKFNIKVINDLIHLEEKAKSDLINSFTGAKENFGPKLNKLRAFLNNLHGSLHGSINKDNNQDKKEPKKEDIKEAKKEDIKEVKKEIKK